MFDDPNVVLHCEKIDKIYPGTKALDQVSFDLLKGKVNVLIGENGAGKSTLMKMIAGIEQPSAGKMYMDGQEVYFKDTNAARAKGIGIIHQELSLFPNMTVYQNIFMGHEKKKGFFLDDKAHSEGAKKILQRLEHEIPPETMVGDLRVGQQQPVPAEYKQPAQMHCIHNHFHQNEYPVFHHQRLKVHSPDKWTLYHILFLLTDPAGSVFQQLPGLR